MSCTGSFEGASVEVEADFLAPVDFLTVPIPLDFFFFFLGGPGSTGAGSMGWWAVVVAAAVRSSASVSGAMLTRSLCLGAWLVAGLGFLGLDGLEGGSSEV